MFVIISLWVAVTNAVTVLLLLKSERLHAVFSVCAYWAVQAELLTPSTWLLLLLVHTFFTMEGGDSEFVNITLPTLKTFLEARSLNASGNKQ